LRQHREVKAIQGKAAVEVGDKSGSLCLSNVIPGYNLVDAS
jgi:hypothetical protein